MNTKIIENIQQDNFSLVETIQASDGKIGLRYHLVDPSPFRHGLYTYAILSVDVFDGYFGLFYCWSKMVRSSNPEDQIEGEDTLEVDFERFNIHGTAITREELSEDYLFELRNYLERYTAPDDDF